MDWLEDSYQAAILKGAADVAHERGASLVVLPGGVVGAQHDNGAARNALYELIDENHFDGLIVMMGTLGNVDAQDALSLFSSGFAPQKICSVAVQVPGAAAVMIDNSTGIIAAVTHLAEVHQRKKIAFLRGPRSNPEAETRYSAYRQALEQCGLKFDARYVVQGDFRKEAGVAAIRELLDSRSLLTEGLDALVAADDSMALAALDELRQRGIDVPGQVAVVGFDDVEEARYSNPPLSSIHQPLSDQGREAMRLVLGALSGDTTSEPKVLDTDPIWRRSCGCIPDDGGGLSDPPVNSPRLDLEASLIRRRELILAEVTRASRGAFGAVGRGWEVRLFNALQDQFKGQEGAFRAAYDALLQQALDAGSDVSVGNQVISALRKQLAHCAGSLPERQRQIESLLHDARILTCDVVERSQAQRRLGIVRWSRLVADVTARILPESSGDKMSIVLSRELPRLGIDAALVCLAQPGQDTASIWAGFGPWGVCDKDAVGESFPLHQVVPHRLVDVDDSRSWVVEPLFIDQDYCGYAALQLQRADLFVYELLRKVLSAAVRSGVSQS